MSNHQHGEDDHGGGSGSIFGGQIISFVVICVACILIYKGFFGESPLFSVFDAPKEVKLTYTDNAYQPNLDEEATLQILSQPEKYRAKFDELVYNFNIGLLYHIANRMNLPDSLKRRLEPAYKQHHEYLKSLYFNDFVALKDTTAVMYENWYNDNANQAVRIFNEVAGKYTCFFTTQIFATLLNASGGKLMARGKNVGTPCDIALTEGLAPMVERLKKKAEIMDFSASRGLLKEKVRQGIAELATYELRSRLALDKTLQYKVFGYSISETDIQVEAISVIKAGFKLDQFFDVTFSPKKGIVYVTLPAPMILSHEVYPKVNKLDVGFLAGITGDEMNRNFNELRRQFREDAIKNEHILDKSKARADSVMQLVLGPVVKSINRKYVLQLRIQDSNVDQGEPAPPTLHSPAPATEPANKPKSTFIPQ